MGDYNELLGECNIVLLTVTFHVELENDLFFEFLNADSPPRRVEKKTGRKVYSPNWLELGNTNMFVKLCLSVKHNRNSSVLYAKEQGRLTFHRHGQMPEYLLELLQTNSNPDYFGHRYATEKDYQLGMHEISRKELLEYHLSKGVETIFPTEHQPLVLKIDPITVNQSNDVLFHKFRSFVLSQFTCSCSER